MVYFYLLRLTLIWVICQIKSLYFIYFILFIFIYFFWGGGGLLTNENDILKSKIVR